MFGRHGDVGCSHQGVWPRGVNLEHAFGADAGHVVGEAHVATEALADPVLLHQPDLLRPAVKPIEIGEQLVGVSGDLHVVHRDFALFDQRPRTPAAAVNHLLVGEHGLVLRIPIDRAETLVDQAFFVEPGEQPLLPAIIVRLASRQLAIPVDGETEPFELALHVLDVGVGPLRWRHLVLDRRVLGRHAEGVPAHRLHHIEALHRVEARQHIADRVVAHMPHVQLARRVGKHRKTVVFWPAFILDGASGTGGVPVLLRGEFNLLRLVFFLHGGIYGFGQKWAKPGIIRALKWSAGHCEVLKYCRGDVARNKLHKRMQS